MVFKPKIVGKQLYVSQSTTNKFAVDWTMRITEA
jgi:hypothetical protein